MRCLDPHTEYPVCKLFRCHNPVQSVTPLTRVGCSRRIGTTASLFYAP
ncbi:hypothetical protein ASZ90_015537 [hydrocarbon metagenome]|uniref:Uncharacterized protein n=1 Tax=hydrocarbon metagenome TaxID=938273 RepID=A0A0W8F1N8_9ZZZZ